MQLGMIKIGQSSKRALAIVVLASALVAFGCNETLPAKAPAAPTLPGPASKPLSASASIRDDNSLIARITGTVDRPGHLYVEYWADGVGRLRSRTMPSDGTDYTLHLVRLRANAAYEYHVFGVGGSGPPTSGPSGTFVTGGLPDVLRKAEFEVLAGEPTADLTFMEFVHDGFWGLIAIDGEGRIVWYYRADERRHKVGAMARKVGGNIVYEAAELPHMNKVLVEITPLGEVVDRLDDSCPEHGPVHHEVQILPDGRVMYLSRTFVEPGFGEPPAPQSGDVIGMWDQRSREDRLVWNIFDFISPADRTVFSSNIPDPPQVEWGPCIVDINLQDWSHGNSATVAADGSVLVSLRHLNQVVSVAPDFQSVEWRLGGPGGEFTFPDPSDRFYQQHTAVAISNGNILLFDNGNFRPGEEGGQYSRAIELELNFSTMTARKVWEYRRDPDVFAACCSGVTLLPNGNRLVLFGSYQANDCCRRFYIVEVDPDGRVVWEVEHRSEGKAKQYRVYPGDSVMGETPVP